MSEIIRDMPYEEYAKRPGVNASLLKIVDRYSLAHAQAYLSGKIELESDALDFGTCFHSLLLEGRRDYVVSPDTYAAPKTHEKVKKKEINEGDPLPWNANAGICKEWIRKQEGATILDSSEASGLEGMVQNVRSMRELDGLLDGDCEVSVFAEYQGVPVKLRTDLLTRGDTDPILDFKKARSSEPVEFLKQALKLRYHIQAAWTLDVLRMVGIDRKSFWLVACEKESPQVPSILELDDVPLSFLRLGRQRYRRAFQLLKNAYASGDWYGYGKSKAEDHAQPWMLKDLETTA